MSDEKSEQPTDKKLLDAREKGDVTQRKNVIETALFITIFGIVGSTWETFWIRFSEVFEASLDFSTVSFETRLKFVADAAIAVLHMSATITVFAGVFVLLVGLFLNGFNFAPKALNLKFEKLNPVAGVKNIFTLQTLYNFIRLLILFSVTSVIIFVSISSNIIDGVKLGVCGIHCFAEFFFPIFFRMILLILLVMIILAVIDYKIQTLLHVKKNKMSKSDVKKEQKGATGDPMINAKRRQISNEDSRLPTWGQVTHVVFSTECLIAMIYDPSDPEMPPYVVAKVAGAGVGRYLSRFRLLKKTCVSAPGIADRLFKITDIGNYVDERGALDAARLLKLAGDLK